MSRLNKQSSHPLVPWRIRNRIVGGIGIALGLSGIMLLFNVNEQYNTDAEALVNLLLGSLMFLGVGSWYFIKGENAEPWTKNPSIPKTRDNRRSTLSEVLGVVTVFGSIAFFVFYGRQLGISSVVSIILGYVIGFVVLLLIMFMFFSIKNTFINREDAKKLRVAIDTKNYKLMDDVFLKRALRAGLTEKQFREMQISAKNDVEERFRQTVSRIEKAIPQSGPLSPSAEKSIHEAIESLQTEINHQTRLNEVKRNHPND